MLWVVVDTIMSGHGQKHAGPPPIARPGHSLDGDRDRPADPTRNSTFEAAAAEKKQRIQQQHDDELKQLETSLSATGLEDRTLELKPQKGDIEADEVTLVWLPLRISPAGAAEPVYSVADTNDIVSLRIRQSADVAATKPSVACEPTVCW